MKEEYPLRRLERAAPLSGVAFLALLISSFIVGGSPPDADDPTNTVVSFWREHEHAQIASSLLAGFAAVFLVWFGGVVRAHLREAEGEPGWFATTALGGFLLIAAGGLALAGFQFTAADTVGDVPATTTQTLAALNRDFFFLLDGGVLVAVFATAAATLKYRPLPRWFGYLSLLIGLIFLTPAFAVAFPSFGIWIAILSMLMLRTGRRGSSTNTSAPIAR
jgi:hypothetical protein